MRIKKLQHIASMSVLVCVLMIFFSVATSSAVQDTLSMQFTKLTIQDGLSQGLVMSCMKDKEGFMWFTSKDGLNKYDGYAFTVYTHNPEDPFSLPDNFVTHTIEDNNGIFWVSTATKGLYIFDKKNEKFFPVSLIDNQKNSSNEVIWRIQIIDNILCVHRTTHVYLYDISSLIKAKDNIFTPQTLSHIICKYQLETSHQKYSYDAWLMPDKSLWICMYDSLRIFSASQSTHLYQQTLSYRTSQLSIKDSEGKYGVYDVPNPNHIMINDNGTIIIYDFANMKPIIKHTYSNDEWTRQLIVKDGSNYWLLSSDSINYHFNASTYTFTPFKNHTVFHSNRVYKACIDNSKRMWLGTTGHGILQYDFRKNLWHSFKHPHNILYTQYDTNEICCTSTDQYEPCIYNIKSRSLRKIIPSTIWKAEWDAWSFLPTGRTTFIGLLLNTNNKKKYIFSYNSSTEVFKTIQYHYSATLGYQNFIQDNSGEIWISGLNNNHSPVLIQLDKDNLALKQTYSFPAKQEYSEYPFISGYFQDNKGIFWFATMQGLFSFDTKNKKWQHFTHDPQRPTMSLPSNILFSICPDPIYPEQYIWIGTNGNGLIQFNRRTHECIYYTERNGLLNNVIYTIIPDSKNNLWLSTNRGLCCMIPLTKNPATQYRFIPFTEEDGLPDNEFNRYEGIRLSNGDLLFGGIKGKVLFTPEKVLQNHIPGNIMITNMTIFNKNINHKENPSILSSNISYSSEIRLSHEQSMFTLYFAFLHYTHNSKKKYKYILEGYDKQWIEAGQKNEATYTNLDPGTYTFKVTAALQGYLWKKNYAVIRIIILPAWWQTWWFHICVIIFILLILYSIYTYRVNEKMKILILRDRIAGDLHDEIGSTLSSIALAGSVLQKKIPDSNSDIQYLLQQINNNTTAMMESMSDIVWAVKTQNDSFDHIIYRMRAFTSEILEPINCMAHFHISDNIRTITPDMNQRKNLYLVFKEAINNIAKYSHATHVWIALSLKEKQITLTIKDDGIGFDAMNNQQHSKLSGNGLYSMKKRAEELHGIFILYSEPDKGTEITVQFTL